MLISMTSIVVGSLIASGMFEGGCVPMKYDIFESFQAKSRNAVKDKDAVDMNGKMEEPSESETYI